MAFSKHICWKDSMVNKVLETDAFQLPDHLFLATHYPMNMYIEDTREGRGNPVPISEQNLLERFTSAEDYILIFILGSAGSGKSHLIRWMSANISENKKRKVIRVPKSGISLKKIIELILQQVSKEHFQKYWERLGDATVGLTHEKAMELLLNNLAIAVGPNGKANQGTLTDMQKYLIKSLPALLYDNYFRRHFLCEGGVIDELVTHIIGSSYIVERREERRGFKEIDLPVGFDSINKAGAEAQDFYKQLTIDDEIRIETVNWLNHCLNDAISSLLNFSGNDLTELMFDVRKELAQQDVELIILIEDLAKTQGIDAQLMDALLERRVAADGTELCVMRTIIGSTTGFFERSVDTTRHRIDFRIYLDLEDQRSPMTDDDLVNLAALYLNAVRLSEDSIGKWHARYMDDRTLQVDNACMGCEHSKECLEAFGAVNGKGLYPFTEIAINNMFKRITNKEFNPRLLIMDVLKHTLDNYGYSVTQGTFPPPALLEHFGGSKMSALLKRELESRDPLNGQRRKILIELWSDGSKIIDIHLGIHEAFALPLLDDHRSQVPDENKEQNDNEKKEEKKDPIGLPPQLLSDLKELDEWQNGAAMSQRLSQNLRELIFSAIEEYIDWDANLMLKSNFVGNSKPFRQNGISFLNQSTQAGKVQVPLKIPLNGTIRADDALALQGMLLYGHYKNWTFENHEVYFAAYAECMEEWSQYVLENLKNLSGNSGTQLIPALAECMTIAMLMSGKNVDASDNKAVIENMFSPSESVDKSMRSKEWNELYESLQQVYPELKNKLLSYIKLMKGQSLQIPMIDTVKLLKPIDALRNNGFRPVVELSGNLGPDDRIVDRTHKKIRNKLGGIIEAEKSAYIKWGKEVQTNLGNDDSTDAVENMREAINKVRDAGVSPHSDLNPLINVIDDFSSIELQTILDKVKALSTIENESDTLPMLSQLNISAMDKINKFISETGKFLTDAEARVNTAKENLGDEGLALSEVQKQINERLESLDEILKIKITAD